MIDRKTLSEISRINRSIPKELTKGLVRKEVDRSTDEQIGRAISSGKISIESARKLDKLRQEGAFIKTSNVTNEKKRAEIEKYVNAKVDQGVKSGDLKNPANDNFAKKMLDLSRRKK